MVLRKTVFILFLIKFASTFSLDCDFRTDCCWRSAEGEGKWEKRTRISANEFRRTFLVGKGIRQPEGPFVMRAENGDKEEGGSSYMSCPLCSKSAVTVRFRHWQSPTAQVSLCWQSVAGQEGVDKEEEDCSPISATEQSVITKKTLFVPIGRQIQLYFLVENASPRTYGVILIDKIAVEYKDCNSTTEAEKDEEKHSATSAIQKGTSEPKKTTRRNHVPSQLESGIRKLKIKSLFPTDEQLNNEVARQIRNLERPGIKDKDTAYAKERDGQLAGRPKKQKKTSEAGGQVSTGHTAISPNIFTSEEPASVVMPQPVGQATIAAAVPAAPLGPTSLGKDFNPLHDLVGKEFSDFLDPGFVTKDEDEGDDPETEAYFKAEKKKAKKVVRPPKKTTVTPLPAHSVAALPTIPPTLSTTHHPLQAIFKHPNECSTPGGCLFENGLCSYTHATLDPNQQFRITKVGTSSFALAVVQPSAMVVIEAPTNFDKEHLIVMDVLENSADVSLRGCCQVNGQAQLYCPFGTPFEGSVVMWQSGRFTCPANTIKLVFMCENRSGTTIGQCGIDNLRLHLPSDILLWEPCQKDQLARL